MIESGLYQHGYKFRIYPTNEQKRIIDELIHLYRFVYNWGLVMEERQYQKKKDGSSDKGFLSFFDICHEFAKYRNLPENAWIQKLPLCTARLALRDVIQAFKDFFHRGYGYPKFKTKKKSPKIFKTRNDRFFIDGNKVRFEGLPMPNRYLGIVDVVDLHHNFGWQKSDKIKYIQPSISIDDLGNYWVSFSIEEPIIELCTPKSKPIGIDVGIKKTMTLSTGEYFIRPNDKIKRLEKRKNRAKRYSMRDVSRRREEAKRTKTKYDDISVSNRAQKRADKVRKISAKITNIKRNFYHNIIKEIVLRNPEAIIIETIRVREIQQSHRTHIKGARHAIAHADFATMHKIIEDKCKKYGVTLIRAKDDYPSSQICSTCGHRQDIGQKTIFKCPICGTKIDRDINAALNLRSLAYTA